MTTERDMLNLLHKRFGRTFRNGRIEKPRYVCAEHVRSKPDFAVGIADFMAADTWRSGQYRMHGFEVKVSRSDWLHELKQPEKAEVFRPYMHYWWLVVSDRKIVRDDLPEGWGLLAATGTGSTLRLVREPRLNFDAQPMPTEMTAALLRAAATTAQRRAVA